MERGTGHRRAAGDALLWSSVVAPAGGAGDGRRKAGMVRWLGLEEAEACEAMAGLGRSMVPGSPRRARRLKREASCSAAAATGTMRRASEVELGRAGSGQGAEEGGGRGARAAPVSVGPPWPFFTFVAKAPPARRTRGIGKRTQRSRTRSPRYLIPPVCLLVYLHQLHCTALLAFPFPPILSGRTKSKRASRQAQRTFASSPLPPIDSPPPPPPHRITSFFLIRRQLGIRQRSSPLHCRTRPTHRVPDQAISSSHGVGAGSRAGTVGVPGARRPGRAPALLGRRRHGGQQRRRQPLRAGHPGQRVPLHLPVHHEGAGAVRQAAGGRHPQGRRHHRQHLEPPADGAEHGGRGGGAAGAGDQGVRGGRAREGVPPGVRRRAGGAAPQGLRLLPLHLLRPRHRHALPLHRPPRLLQRLPRLLPRPLPYPAAGAYVLQGGASPEPGEDGEPVGQHVEAVGAVHPGGHHRQPRVLVHGLRLLRQGAQAPLRRRPAAPSLIDPRPSVCTIAAAISSSSSAVELSCQ